MKKPILFLLIIILILFAVGCNSTAPAEPAAETKPTDPPATEAASETEAVEETTAEEPASEEETTDGSGEVTTAEEPASDEETTAESDESEAQESESTEVVEEAEEAASTETVAEEAVTDAGPEFDPNAPPLILAFIPQENPEKLIGDIETITQYLEAELGFPVKGFVSQDHAAAVEALRNGEADISFMGALPYVLAHDQVGAEVILGEVYRGSPIYHGRIFVHRDSGIETLEDLRGKSIAFADPISESGFLYPLELFVEAGLLERDQDPQQFFSAVYFAGGYQQAIQAVANGYADAAGASQFSDLLLAPEQLEEVIWIAESDPIPSHAVITRSNLEPERAEAFKQAMLKLNEPEYRHLLQHVYSPDGYIEVTHDDYTSVEEIARLYGYIE
ncbi:MAG: phosphate/phosphite/phosphonate ABC transporter substrate-binding protein [Anaerolineae bacterium]|nr:phosphate/phosphite/phosphonate ABC transporter substrate-binding protein [Anaerolineae bacterium]